MALRVRFSRYTLIMNRALRFYLILFEKRWRSRFKMKTEFGKKNSSTSIPYDALSKLALLDEQRFWTQSWEQTKVIDFFLSKF